MALDARIHYRTFARIDLNPTIRSEFWNGLFGTYKVGLNFDGELFGLGEQLEHLIDAGFAFSGGDTSDVCMNTTKERSRWLQSIMVVPHDDAVEPFQAWSVFGSRCNFVQCHVTELFFVREVNSTWEFLENDAKLLSKEDPIDRRLFDEN